MSLEILARQSLKQFSTIYAEVRQERGDVSGEELEALMWEKITGGVSPAQQYIPNVNLIPSHLLKKIKVQLPYMPSIINYLGCPGLKQCGGLYVPCGAKCVGGTGSLCLICTKHDAKFGRLVDRGLPGTYMGGPKPEISYGTWLARQTKKEKDEAGEDVSVALTIEDIYKELREAGFTFKIPEEQLKVNTRMSQAKRRPGRPGVVKKTIVNEDGTESPSGSSLDGFDHKVILGAESDASSLTDEEKPKKKKAEKKPETEAYAKAVTEMVESLDMVQVANMVKPKAKAPKKEEPVDKEKEKELANAVKEAKKAAKADEVAREKAAKELAKAEEKAAKAEKAKAEKAKAEKEPKKEKSKEPKATPKPKAKAPSPKAEEKKSEAEEYEEEDEEIEYEGVKYMLRGDIVYDIEDGSIKGRLSDEGDVELA